MTAADLKPFATPARLPDVPGLRLRHFAGPRDYTGMTAVSNDSRLADDDDFLQTLESLSSYYDTIEGRFRDVVIVEIDGRIVGYGRIEPAEEVDGTRVVHMICFLVPAARRRGIGRALLETLEARARAVVAELPPASSADFQVELADKAVGAVRLVESSGYRPVRYSFRMVRPTLDDQPDAPLPEGIEIREVRPEHLRAIWEADQEAFRDHWGATVGTEEQYRQWLADPNLNDTSLWRIGWDGDEIAGQVRSFINHEANEQLGRKRGMVEFISVRRPWRKRGLARALMAASFPLLRARGMTEGALGVDTENPSGALRVYESVGFRPVSRETVYRKPLQDPR